MEKTIRRNRKNSSNNSMMNIMTSNFNFTKFPISLDTMVKPNQGSKKFLEIRKSFNDIISTFECISEYPSSVENVQYFQAEVNNYLDHMISVSEFNEHSDFSCYEEYNEEASYFANQESELNNLIESECVNGFNL